MFAMPRGSRVSFIALRTVLPLRRALAAGLVLASCVGASVHAGYSFTPLGDLAGGSFSSVAQGVSADGSVVAGYSNSALRHGSVPLDLGGRDGGARRSPRREL
ncbi:MAG: hypothetical protein U1D30_20235 [Planctomycetota bacterium]